jgi:hypothetical protein
VPDTQVTLQYACTLKSNKLLKKSNKCGGSSWINSMDIGVTTAAAADAVASIAAVGIGIAAMAAVDTGFATAMIADDMLFLKQCTFSWK